MSRTMKEYQKESDVERKIGNHAFTLGIIPMKFTSPNCAGVPDRMFLYKGRTLFMEIKKMGKDLEPLQVVWQKKLTKQGFIALKIDSIDEGKKVLETFVAAIDEGPHD